MQNNSISIRTKNWTGNEGLAHHLQGKAIVKHHSPRLLFVVAQLAHQQTVDSIHLLPHPPLSLLANSLINQSQLVREGRGKVPILHDSLLNHMTIVTKVGTLIMHMNA